MLSQDILDDLTEGFKKSGRDIRGLFRLIKEQRGDNEIQYGITYITQEQIDDLLYGKNNDNAD